MTGQAPHTTTLFTIGYEGMTPESFAWVLGARGVKRLVDVRLRPFSRKPGFSKKALAEHLAASGIEYVHMPELGNPPEIREFYKSGSVAEGNRLFRARLQNGSSYAVNELLCIASRGDIALMCLEADYRMCHRHVVADEVAARSDGAVEVTHL